jgi:hypothetical protein
MSLPRPFFGSRADSPSRIGAIPGVSAGDSSEGEALRDIPATLVDEAPHGAQFTGAVDIWEVWELNVSASICLMRGGF